MRGEVLTKRDLPVFWEALVKMYRNDAPRHAYIVHDLVYDYGRTEVYVLWRESIAGYILVWKGERERAAVHMYGDFLSLLPRIADEPLLLHIPLEEADEVKAFFEERGRVEEVGVYLDMKVDRESFNPTNPELAIRLGMEHLEKLADLLPPERAGEDRLARARAILRQSYTYGVMVGGRLVSMAYAYLRMPEVWAIGGVYTHPDYRGRGYAKSVVSAITRDALKCGEWAFLHVRKDNLPAIRVYKRVGYSTFGERLWIKYMPANL